MPEMAEIPITTVSEEAREAFISGRDLNERLRGTDAHEYFEQVTRVATVRHRYAMPYETDLPIFVARRPHESWAEAWPRLRRFI